MMLYPPMSELVDKIGSRYLLVNLVARRAREISAIADDEEIPLDKKPVSTAINEVYTGKLSIVDGVESLKLDDDPTIEADGSTGQEVDF